MAGVSSSSPLDNPGPIDYSESTLEQKQNRENKKTLAKGFQHYPKMLHKPNGLSTLVKSESEEADKLAKGWFADIREIPVDEEPVDTTVVSQMPIPQAIAFVQAAQIEDLAAIEAEEASHGGREKVMKAIEDAKDAVQSKPKGKAKK